MERNQVESMVQLPLMNRLLSTVIVQYHNNNYGLVNLQVTTSHCYQEAEIIVLCHSLVALSCPYVILITEEVLRVVD